MKSVPILIAFVACTWAATDAGALAEASGIVQELRSVVADRVVKVKEPPK